MPKYKVSVRAIEIEADSHEQALRMAQEQIGWNTVVTQPLYTNAPPSYDYPQNIEAGPVPGCRVLDCPVRTIEFQIGRNMSGLFWATTEIEKAAELRRSFPYNPERK